MILEFILALSLNKRADKDWVILWGDERDCVQFELRRHGSLGKTVFNTFSACLPQNDVGSYDAITNAGAEALQAMLRMLH